MEDDKKNNDKLPPAKEENFELVERAHRLGSLASLLREFKRNASLISSSKNEQAELDRLCDLMTEFSYHNIECPFEDNLSLIEEHKHIVWKLEQREKFARRDNDDDEN